VDLAEDGDEALVVDLLFLVREREAGMLLLLPLAVRIESLAECADALLGRVFNLMSL
jgi:hypothetical protein